MSSIFGFLPETKHFGSFDEILDTFCEKSKRMTDTLLVIFENGIDCTVC
jgi:hypothetical protein